MFSERINYLISIGRVKVYNSMFEFKLRNLKVKRRAKRIHFKEHLNKDSHFKP
jgi:hypothetical protein